MMNWQVHAELCYATALLAESVLTMVQDPSFISFVQGAFKFRSCYLAFKECTAILRERNWSEDDSKIHFESGVMLGVGIYNLIVASLPQKVLSLLEFIGFHGDEATGERLLVQQVESFEGYMAVLSCTALLIYQSYLHYIFGNGDADLELVRRTVDKMASKFPQAALGLYFEGRLHQISGRLDAAIEKFELANKVMDDYIPFDAFFNWDHAYLYAFAARWADADATLKLLQEKCSWSEATATYVRAACSYMRAVSECNNNAMPEETLSAVTKAMSSVSSKCKRVAGRTVPIEELMYIWGYYNMFSKNDGTLYKAYSVVLDEVNRLKPLYDCDSTFLPDWCLVRFMQGTLLRYLKQLNKAEEILREVIEHGPELKDEIHSAAFASLELGLLFIDRGHLEQAKERIKETRAYRSFPLSIPVSFKVHSAYKYVKKLLKEDPCDAED
ncbi:tetratricopeptide repeat protein 39B-like [Tropilaelaps mercedesae]|uniref:Tetratricopeptide repeat protein 39B-like n=1 Tax=Tropilaelaps mercedesae TaxID=418985 RepID=A0A1V9XGA4_9ACAR|nr:tetratricopeptide repeat protein 39B-like [Tropilaelaps mercedesae]